MASQLGAFIVSNKNELRIILSEKSTDFFNILFYTGGRDSLYREEILGCVGQSNFSCKNLCQGKNDYESGSIFYGFFLAPKQYCSTINEFGIKEEHKTFKGFNYGKRLSDRSQYFKIIEGKKISAMLPKSWKNSFNSGVIIPAKKRLCNECTDQLTCNNCDNQSNVNKEVEVDINLIKREAPNHFGHMFPYYTEHRTTYVHQSKGTHWIAYVNKIF